MESDTGAYGWFDRNSGVCLYVGITGKSFKERRRKHINSLKAGTHKRLEFNEWFDKNGENALEFRILERAKGDDSVMNELEIYWFNKLQPCFYGQIPSANNKWEHSEETKNKIRQTMRGHYPSLPDGVIRRKFNKLYKLKLCDSCKNEFYARWRLSDDTFLVNYCSHSCVQKAQGIISKVTYEQVKALYCDDQLTINEICHHLGCKKSTVYSILKKYNIPLRGTKKKEES